MVVTAVPRGPVRAMASAAAGLAVVMAVPIGAADAGVDSPSASARSIDCPIPVPEHADVACGELTVPEDHDEPAGAQLKLPYIILRSPRAEPAPDPVVFTAGGPGFSSLGSVWWLAESPLLDERDIIVMEQRGNRYATPALMCDAAAVWDATEGDTPCLDRIRDEGVDITEYTTGNIVRDLVALRHALGYEHWNLYGSSFSTSVMLLAMDADPDGTRSAILHSVKPPNETTFAHRADNPLRAIERMIADCEADGQCASSYPDLERDLFALVRQLNEQPVEMEVQSSADVDSIPVVFDGDHFLDWIVVSQLYQPIFDDHDPAYLPLLVGEATRGNVEPLEIAAQSYWSSTVENPDWAWGLMFAINCQQDVPAAGASRSKSDLAASERLDGYARSGPQLAVCDAWDLAPLSPAATAYVQSEVPTLVFAGSHDPVTPPEWSRTTADHLANSTYVEFPGHGHDVVTDNPCAATLEARFVADPQRELDTSCVDEALGPSFVLRSDVYRAPDLHRSAQEVSLGAAGGVAWVEAVAAVSIYGAILALAVLAVAGVAWLVARMRRGTGAGDPTAMVAYALAVGAAAATIVVAVLLDGVTDAYAGRSTLAFALGPSRDVASARLLAWVAPVAGLVIITLASVVVWAWITSRWSLRFRLLTTASAVCSLCMVMLGLRWDLFTMLV